jgi:hypothetical protein
VSQQRKRQAAEQASSLYRRAMTDPAVELADLLWLADVALATFRDYLYALEADVLQTLPAWQRPLIRLRGLRRLLRALAHAERARRACRRP